jgi:hypothetical protein
MKDQKWADNGGCSSPIKASSSPKRPETLAQGPSRFLGLNEPLAVLCTNAPMEPATNNSFSLIRVPPDHHLVADVGDAGSEPPLVRLSRTRLVLRQRCALPRRRH